MYTNIKKIFKNKKVLITGHTGFKGSWLTMWLLKLNAKVIGYSINVPDKKSLFFLCNIEPNIVHIKGDVRDYKKLSEIIMKYKPDFIFHLAAQSLVFASHKIPKFTFSTNIIGTLNILEIIKNVSFVKSAVIITSDKAYKNKELKRGYKESDELFGEDPYSASKSCAEIISNSYFKSFFITKKNVATARAGNVIGGGDWSRDRIVPDYFKSKIKKKKIIIRNPKSTRPWQHVLEPIGGYLILAYLLFKKKRDVRNNSFNFGPANNSKNKTVFDLVSVLSEKKIELKKNEIKNSRKETILLQLDIKKSKEILNWSPVLNFNETCNLTKAWYLNYINSKKKIKNFTYSQIDKYISIAIKKNKQWIK